MPYEGTLRAEQQTILAGNQFDGTLPDNGFNDAAGSRVFVPDANGGLVDLAPHTDAVFGSKSNRVRRVMSVKLKLGGQSAWSISIAGDHPDIVWISGTTETDVVHDEAEGVVHLAPNERLKISTTGASAELTAHVLYELVGDALE